MYSEVNCEPLNAKFSNINETSKTFIEQECAESLYYARRLEAAK